MGRTFHGGGCTKGNQPRRVGLATSSDWCETNQTKRQQTLPLGVEIIDRYLLCTERAKYSIWLDCCCCLWKLFVTEIIDMIWLLSYMEGKDGMIGVLYGKVRLMEEWKSWFRFSGHGIKTGLGFRREEENRWEGDRVVGACIDRWKGGSERTTYRLRD